jgi:putative endonuclease
MERQPAVYLRTNRKCNALYLGVTNNLFRRDWEHRNGKGGAFSSRDNMIILVWYKLFETIPLAIQETNPEWHDLGAVWHEAPSNPIASSLQNSATTEQFKSSQ